MLISSPHNLNLCSGSQETCSLKNVFEAVQKTRSTCFIGSKTTRLRNVVLNPIKHSCSFFKHYLTMIATVTVYWRERQYLTISVLKVSKAEPLASDPTITDRST